MPLTPTERERWKDAARGAGMSTAAFVRRATDKWIAEDEAIAADEHWQHGHTPTLVELLDPVAELKRRG